MSFIDTFFEDGNINTILAPPKEGKTNFAVWLAFQAILQGYTVLSNIAMFKPENIPEAIKRGWLHDTKFEPIPEKFKYIPLASKLILEASQGDRNIVIIDEGGISASSSRAMTDTVVQFKYLGYSIRKIGACLIIIAQTKGSIVPVLRKDLVDYEIHIIKHRNKTRDTEILKSNRYYNKEKRDYDVDFTPYDYIKNIPYSTVAYDTRHPGGFTWDIDLHSFYQEIAESGYDSVEIRREIPRIINNMVAEKKIDEHLKKRKFMRTSSVADLFKVHPDTIRNWVDKGIINCIRTEGGDRLFSRSEVTKLAINKGIF